MCINMYRNLDYLKDIHILAKFFSFILFLFSIIFVHNPIFLFVFAVVFFAFFRNIYTFLCFLLFFILAFWFPGFLIIAKAFILLSFIMLNFLTIHFQEVRQFIEYFSYHKKQSRITYLILYICYFGKYYLIYFKEFLSYRKSYGKHVSPTFLKYIIVQSFSKTKMQINSLIGTYRYRFYNFSNKRSYVEKNRIAALDIKYILLFVILFLVVCLWGR